LIRLNKAIFSLKVALDQNLKTRWSLSKIGLGLRAEMFDALGQGYNSHPSPSQETRLINELVREYLQYNGYIHSLSVFQAGEN
jgi:lisH domain-containing protein FOPNL